MSTGSHDVVVASNRGPVQFVPGPDGVLVPVRGGGGLVTALESLRDGLWVCTALSDPDRAVAALAPGGRLDLAGLHDRPVRMLEMDPETYDRAYNGLANQTLWYLLHGMFDLPHSPVFDDHVEREWVAYQAYSRAFADAVAAEAAPRARVLLQDYHVLLVAGLLRAQRPDLRIGLFSHTPWPGADQLALLPARMARPLLAGVLACDHVGFLSPRWAAGFAACCAAVLGAVVTGGDSSGTVTGGDSSGTVTDDHPAVLHDGRTTTLGVHPLGVDEASLHERAHRPDVDRRVEELRARTGGRRLVVRVDRTEPSKNIVRGLLAYRHLLRDRPQWRGEIVHLAFAYPSRGDVPAYREYTAEVVRLVHEINDEFSQPGWRPVLLEVSDDLARSLAAYRLADVLVVNPIRDGMNLVAKEAPVISDSGLALVLSEQAGAADELGDAALMVNPFDIVATADAIHEGLAMTADERSTRTRTLAEIATACPPAAWLEAQLQLLT